MGKKKKIQKYSEAQLISIFGLDKTRQATPQMLRWLGTTTVLSAYEQETFSRILAQAIENIDAWAEEDLKMNFIAFILELANLKSSKYIRTFFDKTIEAERDGFFLKVKSDFMIGKGILDMLQVPYFHFQEYKKEKDPNGDPLAQLLEAFLIAQVLNKNQKPIYGCYVIGRFWYFVIMEEKQYCISEAFDSTKADSLLQIIAVLRHFKQILETELIVD
jgi:hypothetical protein